MSKPPGRCIFCGNTGVSKEHVWAEWLGQVVPAGLPARAYNHFWASADQPRKWIAQNSIYQPAHPGTRKIRKVCIKCNTGWMSRLQSQAKNCLTPLLLGQTPVVSAASQKIIARWSAVTAVVADFMDPRAQCVSAEDRRWLAREEGLPPNWLVWAGRYAGVRWDWGYLRIGTTLARMPKGTTPDEMPPANTQITTFVLGRAVFHAFNSPMVAEMGVTFRTLRQMWPWTPSDFDWTELPTLDDDAVDDLSLVISEVLDDFLQRQRNV